MKTPFLSIALVLLNVAAACALEVTNTTDAGAGSLRDAIANTPSGGTVTFAAGVDGGTITLANGQLVIDKDLIIDASPLVGGITIDANGASTGHRVLQIDAGVTVQLHHLTLTGGKSADGLDGTSPTDGADGGGILNEGDLTLTGCSIAGNATGVGGAGADGSLSIPNGAAGGHGGNGGGIFNSAGASLVLIHCTVSGNSTGWGGDGGSKHPALAIGNGGRGGNGGDGAGIYNMSGADLDLTQCTVSGNTTGDAGLKGTGDSDGAAGLGGSGGGVRDQGALTINNTLITGNQTGTNRNPLPSIPNIFPGSPAIPGIGPDLAKSSGAMSGIGVNFIGDPSGSSVALTGIIRSGDARLTPFGNYGGSTPIMLPRPGSPVIDPASGDSSSPYATDQRGVTRVINGTVDIGAVEYVPVLAFEVDTLADENDGFTTSDISLREAIENAASGGTITFAPGVSGGTTTLTLGQLLVERDLTIDASALVGGITIDANGAVTTHRALQVQSGATVDLNGLMITGGRTAEGQSGRPSTSGLDGGGIHNSGDLTLTGCTVEGSTTGDGGKGFGGSIFGPLGGADGSSGGKGGGIYNAVSGSLILRHCTVHGNSTGKGGAGGSGANGAITGGSGGEGGNGGFGAGIFSGNSASLNIVHSTISGNSTGDAGFGGTGGSGGAGDGSSGASGTSRGGGIRDEGALTLDNTIISDNQTGFLGSEPDLSKSTTAFTRSGVNFIGNLSGSGKSASSTLLTGDAMLSSLGDHGGGIFTMRPQPGSPVIDPAAGSSSSPFPADQRGFARVINGKVDIGAVEYAPIVALEVDILVDENDGIFTGGISLRDSIAIIAPGGTITFAAALSGGTITLISGQLLIERDLTIDASALADGITIDANGTVTDHRVVTIDSGAVVALSDVTLTNGRTPDGSGGDGGGIHNSGTLTLTDCTVSNCATGSGGGGGEGGGIFNNINASLTLLRSIVSGNSTGDGNGPGGAGGGIYSSINTPLTLTECTITGNSTGNGGGSSNGGSGGGIYSLSSANPTLSYCTISGNTTGQGGSTGAGGGTGGGIHVAAFAMALNHCTISGNSTGEGGTSGRGGSGGGIHASSGASLTLTHCTVSSNATGNGDLFGGFGGGLSSRGDLDIINTLIDDNQTGDDQFGSPGEGPDVRKDGGSFVRSGINFIGDLSGSGLSASGTLLSGDAMLMPLGNHGGFTQTQPPLLGSPVIDPAGGATTSPYAFDQRGFVRVSNGTVDIGAVEHGLLVNARVDTLVDENDGIGTGGVSLREAIAAIAANGTVDFDPSLSGATITLTNGQLVIDKNITIDASALAGGITIDADGLNTNHRVLEIASGATVALKGMTLTGGRLSDGLTGLDSTGGGILNRGTLILTRCTISGNTTGAALGGFGGFGGGLSNVSGAVATLTDCNLCNNTTGTGFFGGGFGGGIYNGGTLSLTNCTISLNATGESGVGGIGGIGGGIHNEGVLNLTHCTVFANTTGNGIGGGTAGTAGGISDGGTLTLDNTLIAGNTTGTDEAANPGPAPDLAKNSGSFTGNGVNFIGDPSGSSVPLTGTILNGDANLAPLGDFGGPTKTRPPLPGSPVIDAAGSTALALDQRGFNRTVDGDVTPGAVPDIGAVEYDPGMDLDHFWPLDGDNDGNTFGIEFALGTDWLIPDPDSPNNPVMVGNLPSEIEITFGLNPAALPHTKWVVVRSIDMETFAEIYSYDGPTANNSEGPGVTAVVGATSITITDLNPPIPRAFYKVGAEYVP